MIKPYYEEQDITIYCGDCLEIMKEFPDKSFDLVLTDPPYGINFCSSRTNRKEFIANDGLAEWKTILPDMLSQFNRLITDTGCCCCCCGGGKTPVTAIFTLEVIKQFSLIQTLVWKKFIGLGWRYRPSYENIVIFSKDDKDYNFFDTSKKCSNVIENINQDIPQYNGHKPGCSDEHPTQKPVALMKKLLCTHSLPWMLVLDPFLGGGTTAVACKELGRKCVGIEISEKYCEIAVKRLKNTTKPMF
jgi:DNA modification methylase